MKKLLYVASSYGHILSFHIPYIKKLQEMNFEVHVAAAGALGKIGANTTFSDALRDIPKIDIPFQKKIFSPKNLGCTLELVQLIKKERYDVISVHTSLAAFFVRLAVMLIRGSKPTVINTVHGYLFDKDTPFLKRNIFICAERVTMLATDVLVVMNQQDYEIAEKYHLYRKRLIKIPGVGIDTQRFSREKVEEELLRDEMNNGNRNGTEESDRDSLRRTERLKFGIVENDIVLIYAAEFSKRKNQRMLIEAMSDLPPNVKLLLAGEGEQLEECRKLTEHFGLNLTEHLKSKGEQMGSKSSNHGNRVLFLGHVKNLESYYYLSDICVSASRSEGLPFNIMEAMSMGLPIVATNVKGHQDLVEEGVNGYLYDYDGIEGYVEVIKWLIKEHGSLRNNTDISKNNVIKAREYSLDNVINEVLNVYSEV
ncbi:glycosyltransferase [Aminipila sp.]|uniref:glycosyltransferase n=1 Tax=Aminipila sp. TaxID=2060095 RepID=UPI00289A6458|nr:glycosyltransferase [Aminipila sp.]